MNISITDFLRVFRQDGEPVNLRTFPPRGAEGEALKIDVTLDDLATDQALQQRLKDLNQRVGIYFVVNVGGHDDASISRFTAVFCESDDQSLAVQHAALDAAPLQPSVRVETRKSVHAYWPLSGECSETEWRGIHESLIARFNGDPKIKNPSRVMRLPGFDHLYVNGSGIERKKVVIHTFRPDRRYTTAELIAAFPPSETNQEYYETRSSKTYETWNALNEELKRRILRHPSTKIRGEWAHSRGVCHQGQGETALAMNLVNGAYSCHAKCSTPKILTAFGLPERPGSQPEKEAEEDEPRFNIIHADELAHFRPAEMISGTILVRGGMNLLWGQPEAGKSLFAILTAAALSMFMTVLYIAAEGVSGLYFRLRALKIQLGQTYRDLYILPSEVNLMDPLDSRLLLATIREKNIKPELIVFDTFARCMVGGEENSNSDMGVAIANAAMIARSFDATSWFLHHPTKDGKWERGAGALRGAIDSSAEITNTDGLVKVELSKLKDGERWEPRSFRILSVEVGNGRTAPCLTPANSTSTAGTRLTEGQLKALEFLALPVFEDSGAHAKDIESVCKIAHASLYRILSALKEGDLIKQGKRGNPYSITQAGRDQLAKSRSETRKLQSHACPSEFSQAGPPKSRSESCEGAEGNLWEGRI